MAFRMDGIPSISRDLMHGFLTKFNTNIASIALLIPRITATQYTQTNKVLNLSVLVLNEYHLSSVTIFETLKCHHIRKASVN